MQTWVNKSQSQFTIHGSWAKETRKSRVRKDKYSIIYKYTTTSIQIQNYKYAKKFHCQVETGPSKEEDLPAALEEWREKCDRIHLESEKM